MIFLDITNSSAVVASKVGKYVEKLTPDGIDHSLVEKEVIKKMIENLSAEGLKGKLSIVQGVNVDQERLFVNKNFKVISETSF